MKLIITATNETVVPGTPSASEVKIVSGVKRGSTVKVQAIVLPTDENPYGLIKYNMVDGAWRELFPHVIGAEFVEENV